MFTTDTIVYPCEQNQNWYENGLATQANLRFRDQTGLIGLRIGTCVNVALGEFRGSSCNTKFYYQIKIFLSIFKTCPW